MEATTIDLTKINLRKDAVINLKKSTGMAVDSKAQVVLAVDFSGSMDSLYRNKTVQDVVERILPFGLAFDDNGEVDTYIFHDGCKKVKAPITIGNLADYVDREIYSKYSMGGTNYAPVLKAIFNDFKPASGFLGMGSKKTMDYPVYVIFITDGNNSDKSETEAIVREMSKYGFFVQFIGIGNEKFSFLEKLDDLSGRELDNANFLKIKDIKNIPDADLYQGLMTEYPGWTTQAKTKNFIK